MKYLLLIFTAIGYCLTPCAQVLPSATEKIEQTPSSSLMLKASNRLQEKIMEADRTGMPTFVQANNVEGVSDIDLQMTGKVEIRRADTLIKADKVQYDPEADRMHATGNVYVNRSGNLYMGPELDLKVDAFEGFFSQPTFKILRNGGNGGADVMKFVGDQKAIAENAVFTTCQRKPGPSWLPDWILRADKLELDGNTNEGRAEGATLRLKDIPLLPIPSSISFPLSDDRKSGFLAPVLALDNVNGFEYAQPYYFNLAPNRDATLTPTLYARRGLATAGEFRYLESVGPDIKGQMQFNYMPYDALRDRPRWGFSQNHLGLVNLGEQNFMSWQLNLNKVSDNNYWQDFPRSGGYLGQRLLPMDAKFTFDNGPVQTTVRALQWQTIQDPLNPLIPPYDRLPQINSKYVFDPSTGWDVSIQGDYTKFQADQALVCASNQLNCQPNSQRVVGQIAVAKTWDTGFAEVTPKIAFNARAYQFDSPLVATGQQTASVSVPTFSLNAQTLFERKTQWFDRSWTQTFEPRIFYVSTPYRNQNFLPVYDTGRNDYNFASIFNENPFSGQDRIADNQLLTVGATSRFLDPISGAEAARFGLAQRVRFSDQNIYLPGELPTTERWSDTLMGATVNLNSAWAFDTTEQINTNSGQSVRSVLNVRYSPSDYRLLNVAYRREKDIGSEIFDLAWQWPINDLWGDRGRDMGAGNGQGENRWYAVGRLNYNIQEKSLVDAIIGMEYDAGCWLGRVVFERLQTGLPQINQRIMFQLEFVGFGRVGPNPLQQLKTNIPRYQYLRDQLSPTPNRFGMYD